MKRNILYGIIIALFIQIISPLSDVVQATTLKRYDNQDELVITNGEVTNFTVNEDTLQNLKTVNEKSLSIKEDIDTNGIVDILDLSLVSSKYNTNKDDKNYDESLDLNSDGIIDIFDLISISKEIGNDPFLLAGTYEEDNRLIKYKGNWKVNNDINFSNNSIKISDNVGDSIEFKFYGTGIEWYSLCSINSGKANIYIDGVKVKTKDSYLWADYYNRLEFHKNDLELGMHTVKIENTGTKNNSSKGYNVSIDRIIINNSLVGNIENNYTIYQQTTSGKLYVGQYPTLDDAIYHGSLYANMYALDSEGNEVWTNSYKVYQDTLSGQKIFVGRYDNFDSARTCANGFRNSYIIDPDGNEIWRGKYELWQGNKFLNRYTTLEDAIAWGKKNDNTIIKDIFDDNKVVWENKFLVYQITEKSQTSALVAQYKTYSEAITKAKQFANTYIINGNNEEIWTNSYSAFQDGVLATYELGRYDTFESAKNKAYWYKNAYVVDGNFNELWRARYEVYQTGDNWSTFLGRHNTLDAAIKQANEYSFTKIIDVVDGDDLVWSQGERIRSGHVSTDGSNVNVRKSNDINSEVIGSLPYATKVEVIESWMDDWYKIKYQDVVGYVENKYISLDAPKELPLIKTLYVNINGSTLNIRQAPSTSSHIMGTLYNGDSVKVVGIVNDCWYRIRYSGGYGYVMAQYLSESIPVIGVKYVNTSALKVRTGPGTNYSEIGTVSFGQALSIISHSTGWYKIKFGSGYGFVNDKYVQNNKPNSSNNVNTSTPIEKPSQSKIDKAIAKGLIKKVNFNYICNNVKYDVYYKPSKGGDGLELNNPVIFLKSSNKAIETDAETLRKLTLMHSLNMMPDKFTQAIRNYKTIKNDYLYIEADFGLAAGCFAGIKAVVFRDIKQLVGTAAEIVKNKISVDTLIIGVALAYIENNYKTLENINNIITKRNIYNFNELEKFYTQYRKLINELDSCYKVLLDEISRSNTVFKVIWNLLGSTSKIVDSSKVKNIKEKLKKFTDITESKAYEGAKTYVEDEIIFKTPPAQPNNVLGFIDTTYRRTKELIEEINRVY